MKGNSILILIGAISFIVAITLVLVNPPEKTMEIVDCYDEHSHKIIGLECENYALQLTVWMWLFFSIGMFSSGIGLGFRLCEVLGIE